MKKHLIIGIIGMILVGSIFIGYSLKNNNFGGGDGKFSYSCTSSTTSNASIGTTTGQILATSSRRAWARITQVQTTGGIATSTPFLSFGNGAAAVANTGVTLGTTTPSVDFGLNTDFPYTGAVQGIVGNVGGAGNASTTVQVTECLY